MYVHKYSGLKYRLCENLNKISILDFALALGPHNENKYNNIFFYRVLYIKELLNGLTYI